MEQEKPQLTDKQVLEAYLADSSNKELHVKMAKTLDEQFRGKWFSIKDVNRKTAVKSSKEASQMVLGLTLFNLATSREMKGVTQFKIILTAEQKLKVLQERKEAHLRQIALLDSEIEKIKKEEWFS